MSAPWGLIEKFANQYREKPEDASRGAEMIAEALQAEGVPVTMYAPELYLSLPGAASVEAEGVSFAAKPPAFCASVPMGVEAELLFVAEASGGTPLDRNPSGTLTGVAGKIAVIEGFALPNFVAGLEAAGAAGVAALVSSVHVCFTCLSTKLVTQAI